MFAEIIAKQLAPEIEKMINQSHVIKEEDRERAIDALCSLEIPRDNGGNVGVSCGAYSRLPRDRAQGIVEAISAGLIPSLGVLPRWIPVGERLPEDGQLVDVWYLSSRYADMVFRVNDGRDYFVSIDCTTTCWLDDKKTFVWMPIMKGPMV